MGSKRKFKTTAGARVLWKRGPSVKASIKVVPGAEGFTEQGWTPCLRFQKPEN